MNIFVKANGEISKMNVFNFVAFLFGVVELAKPFLPPEYLPYVALGVSVVNLYLRTFQSSGQPIQGVSQG